MIKAHLQELVVNINNSNTVLIISLLQKVISLIDLTEPKVIRNDNQEDFNKVIRKQLGEISESSTTLEASESTEAIIGFTDEFRSSTTRD